MAKTATYKHQVIKVNYDVLGKTKQYGTYVVRDLQLWQDDFDPRHFFYTGTVKIRGQEIQVDLSTPGFGPAHVSTSDPAATATRVIARRRGDLHADAREGE